MTKDERQNYIMEVLLKKGSENVSALTTALGVSSVTIRKDLTELEQLGKLYRSHGRAIVINPYTNKMAVSDKDRMFPEEKYGIGEAAAKLIDDNDSILIGSGTSLQAFANCIHPKTHLNVISTSLHVSEALVDNDKIKVIQLGGTVRPGTLSVEGPYSESFLSNYSFNKFFLGADGIDLDYGLTTSSMLEASLCRKMMEAAKQTILLADSSKFGQRNLARICDMDSVDVIVTDAGISDADTQKVEGLGIKLIVAKSKPEL